MRYLLAILRHEEGRGYWIWSLNVFLGDRHTLLFGIMPPGEWTSDQANVRTFITTQTGKERRYGKLESVVADLRKLCGDIPAEIDLRLVPPTIGARITYKLPPDLGSWSTEK